MILYFEGMKRMRVGLWGLLLVLSMVLLGCGKTAPETDGSVLRIGNGGEPRDLDPHTVSGVPEVKIIQCLMEGLVTYHPTDDEIPYAGAAERWEVSEDGRTWRFFLREDGRWSNGDPVTASDFVYAWKRVLHPDLGNEYADWMYMIEGAEAYHRGELDDFSQVGIKADSPLEFRVVLKKPVADFLKMLLNHTFLPVHPPTIEAHGGPGVRQSGWTQPGSFIGNGAYRLVEWKPDSIIRVEASPTYWDAESVRTPALEFYPISDENTELRAFESGQLHITGSIPVNMRAFYRERYPEKIRFDPYVGVYFYRVNTTRPPLDDVRVRRALSLTIDRQQIIDRLLQGNERVATAMVPSGAGGYESPTREVYNPERARALLAEAGYPGGEGFPEVELLFNTSDNHRKIAEAIQNKWRDKLGIDITLTNKEWKVYLNTTKEMDYELARAGWIGNLYPYSFLRTLLSFSPNNDTGFSNPEYDRLLVASTHELDKEKRLEMVREAELMMLEAEPIIPIYWYTNVYLIDPRVREWHPKLVDQRPMKFVYLEE
jgi:oligopeptide transport system substrate-binding protein